MSDEVTNILSLPDLTDDFLAQFHQLERQRDESRAEAQAVTELQQAIEAAQQEVADMQTIVEREVAQREAVERKYEDLKSKEAALRAELATSKKTAESLREKCAEQAKKLESRVAPPPPPQDAAVPAARIAVLNKRIGELESKKNELERAVLQLRGDFQGHK